MRIFAISIFLYLSHYAFAEGFQVGTLVQTPSGLKPIEELHVGDTVLSYSFGQSDFAEKEIIAISAYKTTEAIKVKIADEFLVTDRDQTFYSQKVNSWISASEYFEHSIDEEVELFRLSVVEPHNYYISSSNIIAHNFAMAITAAIPGIGPVIGVGILALTIGTAIHEKTKGESKGYQDSNSGTPDTLYSMPKIVALNHYQWWKAVEAHIKKLADKKADDFEKEISKGHSNDERIAKIKEITKIKADKHRLRKNKELSRKNGRDIYTDKDGNHWSVDTRHGRFEKLNGRGKHQGEYDIDLKPVNGPDKSGQHDIVI